MIHKKTTEELVQERLELQQVQNDERTQVSVLVDNVRSLDNVGLLFRLCELARVEQLYLTGYTGHPRLEKDEREEGLIARHEHRIMKTAVYALPQQPWRYEEDPVAVVKEMKEEGVQIVVLEQTSTSLPYNKVSYDLPLTLIVGHERQGVRQELIDLADTVVEIPILGKGNSHNVAVSCGILLYNILVKTGQI